MKEIIEIYEQRLKTVMTKLEKGGNDLAINSLGAKASCYRNFISEMKNKLNTPIIGCSCTELKSVNKMNYSEWKKRNKYVKTMQGYYKKGDNLVSSMDVVLKYKDYQESF